MTEPRTWRIRLSDSLLFVRMVERARWGHRAYKLLTLLAVLSAALFLTGCQGGRNESAEIDGPVELGPKYSAKHGLLVPEETRLSLGLQTVEVSERKVAQVLEIPIRVYRTNESLIFASGMVLPEQAENLAPGQNVEAVTSDGQNFHAKIRRVTDSQLQKASGFAELLVEIRSPSQPIAVGTFLTARAFLDSDRTAVSIPQPALLQCSDGSAVYAVSGEHFVRTPVKVGAISEGFVEITDGLYVGDQVVVQPVMSLWMIELAAVKGGQACCVIPPKGK